MSINDFVPDTEHETLLTELELSISTQKQRDGQVVSSFLGIHNDDPMCLAAIARELEISRERVRQVLNRARKSILADSTWTRKLQEKLDKLLQNRRKPLRVYMLALEDEWFEDTANKPLFLQTVLHKFIKSNIRVTLISKIWTISRVSEDGFTKLKKNILRQFECAADESYTESETLLLVSAFLHGRNQAYLIEDINNAIAPYLHFHAATSSLEKRLIGVGNSIGSMVQAALNSFDSPQHYTEVAVRFCELTGATMDDSVVKKVHHSLVTSRFLLYGRGTYGTWDHFPLPSNKRAMIARESAKLLRKEEVNRQWHAVEIMDILLRKSHERVQFLVPCLDKYSLSILLTYSESFDALGRMVFKLSEGRVSDNRLDISDLAEKVLLDAGRPLPRFELLNRMRKYRGMNSDICQLVSPKVGRTSPGVWGLVERDFILDEEGRRKLLNLLEDRLRQVKQPLDHCELGLLLKESITMLPEKFSTYLLIGLAETDDRFRISRTSVYLSEQSCVN